MSNSRAKLEYEANVTPFPMSALTDSGDAKIFNSQVSLFSEQDGFAPDVRPNGVLTGGLLSVAASGADDVIDVSALTCYLAGVLTPVSAATDLAIARPATNVAKVVSVTVNSSGSIVAVSGTDGASAVFTEARGEAGGPPYIPVGSIELGQVRMTTSAAAPIAANLIFQAIGTHREKSDFPGFTVHNNTGRVEFEQPLPLIHTGDAARGVFASYGEPIFTEQRHANDYVPPETSHSVSSEQVYNDTVGTESSSISQGSFTAILKDGITDQILSMKNQTLWFRFYQDRYKTAHDLSQGRLGISRTFGAADNPKVGCTISARRPSDQRAS